MSSNDENASQASSCSLDLQLSQDTVNQVLSAVGMSSGTDGNRYTCTILLVDWLELSRLKVWSPMCMLEVLH